MEFNSKKLERTSKLVYSLISLVLCIFLIALSENIIGDLDPASRRPELESFVNQKRAVLESQQRALQAEMETLQDKNATIEQTIATARQNYDNEKQSFENWIKTRKTLGSPDKDQEVVDRARQLDQYYKIEQDWRAQLTVRQQQIERKDKQKELLQSQIDQENQLAETRLEAAQRRHDLKVFLIRLLFVGPILGLGIVFFVRYRKHKFWPLYFGFSLFSLYAFFFGLVPYLPSYGGYVRYGVGVIASAVAGIYAIRAMQRYVARRAEAERQTESERRRALPSEEAIKRIAMGVCPGCERAIASTAPGAPANFCVHCGMTLFDQCGACGTRKNAFFHYCPACGVQTAGAPAAES